MTSRPVRSFSIHVRANHGTSGPEPARRTVGGRWRPTGWRRARRWLPGPRAVAAGGALLAQLWGFGAPGACAAAAEALPEPAGRTVGRTLTGGGAAVGGPSAGHPGGVRGGTADGTAPGLTAAPAPRAPATAPGPSPAPGPSSGPDLPGQDPTAGLLDRITGPAPADAPGAGTTGIGPATGGAVPELDGATAVVGSALQDRIRAGGLPLPGQRAAVPDAFAIASGLLGTVPAQARPAEAHTTRGESADGPAGGSAGTGGSTGTGRAAGDQRHPAAPPPAPAPSDRPRLPAPGHPGTADAGSTPAAGTAPGRTAADTSATAGTAPAPARAAATTAVVTVAHDAAGTATSVLAPIAAGLALTAAAMYKHRGLPKGH
ncbi:hypothetical protein [Kitasatospora purpeofusca]|uniref:hypothetical protein n=1 Tax=Kitasatospora purpeofusca TaxID=67352 RepID=UPI002254E2CF|nr:hypothetical protein [Kitasatospora purpeofusca]MCX4752829.1 hypothetical protein [Kitasatospora purpeofusca]WSR32379.1 hypothetical protein OG715_16135 [Kitasatospora purpeofusca]WSR40469.1 hypothetical protein OG196_15925 [Kitasatospora purpeofusca]